MRILLLSLGMLFASELEVQGNLKVTGTLDANGNPITNVGEPILTTDVATANYVNTRTAGKGRIITLKCAWSIQVSNGSDAVGSCEAPLCPNDWNELAQSNEVTSVTGRSNNGNEKYLVGNSIRYCIEQEDEE